MINQNWCSRCARISVHVRPEYASGVLPYIDLCYWAKANGKNIPNHIIGDWLFPDDMVDVAEKIRKVTQPLAKRSVNPNFIRTLSALKL